MMHYFDVDIATKYGQNCAVILQHIRHWTDYNKANRKNFHDGYYWTYNSVKAFAEQFPYMTPRQISTALKKLEESGLIITGNYNENTYDRTLWYAVTEKGYALLEKRDYEETEISESTVNEESSYTVENEGAEMSNALCKNVKCITPKCKMDYAEMSNALCKNVKCITPKCKMDYAEMSNPLCKNVKPIPDNKPNNKPDIKAEEEQSAAASSLSESEYLNVVEAYNKSFDKKITLTPKREHAIEFAYVFLSQIGVSMEDFLKRVDSARFLKGKEWATFDWIMNPEHIARIVEGAYDLLKDPNEIKARIEALASYDLEQFKADALKPIVYSKQKRSAS